MPKQLDIVAARAYFLEPARRILAVGGRALLGQIASRVVGVADGAVDVQDAVGRGCATRIGRVVDGVARLPATACRHRLEIAPLIVAVAACVGCRRRARQPVVVVVLIRGRVGCVHAIGDLLDALIVVPAVVVDLS